MSFSQVIRADWVGEGRKIAAAFTESGNTKASFDEDVPIGAADKEYAFAFDITKLMLIFMLSPEVLTIKTNSTGAPDDTIVLIANKPLLWAYCGDADYYRVLITTDVTKLFITNASGVVVRLQIETLFNSEV